MELATTTRNLVGRQRHAVVLFTYLLALLAWGVLVSRSLPMPGSEMGMQMSNPGMPEAMALSDGAVGVGLYLLIWGTMMTAMMYPSTAPAFRVYYRSLDAMSASAKIPRLLAVMGTFSLVWLLTGLVPLAVALVVPIPAIATQSWLPLLGGSLVVVSVYQRSAYKRHHLVHCREPLAVADPGSSIRDAVAFAGRLSVASVGCCWALMALMVVVGSMNLVWMVAITVLVSAELLVPRGEQLAVATGTLFAIGGVAVLLVGFA